MGRLSDNLFYAQEKSHKHWLLSLDTIIKVFVHMSSNYAFEGAAG